jgi:hypothetical protein
MNLNLNDFLQYAETGTAPTVYSRQQAAKKAVMASAGPVIIDRPIRTPISPIRPIPQPPVPSTPSETQKPALELVMYSDRSFAIFGDTKPVKDRLTGLFGKFNPYLKKDGVATPGYIFSIGRLDAVRKALSI